MTNLNQNGRSMIEMLGVLAIIGVLSVGGIAGYSKAMLKFKTNKTIDQIAMTVTNIRTLYAQQPVYDITDKIAYDMGVADDAMTANAAARSATKNVLTNPFGGGIYINSVASGKPGDTTKKGAFVITFTNLPREACVSIATNDWGSNYSSGLLGIGTGKTAVTAAMDLACNVASPVAANSTAEDTTGVVKKACATDNKPLSVADAAAGCDCTGDNANKCFVTLKYY